MRNGALIGMIVITALMLPAVAPAASPAPARDAPPGTYPVTLPPQTFQAVVAYLKRQPWEDVQPLMAALAQAAQASLPTAPEKPPGAQGGSR